MQAFRENDVDLDIIRELSASDLAEMGVTGRDAHAVMEAAKRLPPGSYRCLPPSTIIWCREMPLKDVHC